MSPSLRSARNYYAWIADQFAPLLGQRVLDVGGGHGAHLEHVVAPGRSVVSLDLSEACVQDMTTYFSGSAFEARTGDITDPTLARDLAAARFDTILCINVLEHIERDDLALRNMAEILRPAGGRVFLFVPAHPFLYGSPDVMAGHFRRYTRSSLGAALRHAGFSVRRAYYFNGLGALPYFVNARILRPRSLAGSVDRQIQLFDRYLVPLLHRLERGLRPPFGQSLVAIAETARP
jgi:SAM-dependent methyltransferase